MVHLSSYHIFERKWNWPTIVLKYFVSEKIISTKNGGGGTHLARSLNSKFLKGLTHSAMAGAVSVDSSLPPLAHKPICSINTAMQPGKTLVAHCVKSLSQRREGTSQKKREAAAFRAPTKLTRGSGRPLAALWSRTKLNLNCHQDKKLSLKFCCPRPNSYIFLPMLTSDNS